MYPPHHLGGYELVWRGATEHLRGAGHRVRVLTTDFDGGPGGEDDPEVFRELSWYWHDHAWPRLGWRRRLALERGNAATLRRHLGELAPDAVAWWSMGGMSLSLLEQVRRAGLPAVAFVHDDWLVYGPQVDAWLRTFRGRRRALAPVTERAAGVPARVALERAARYLFVSATTLAHARAAGHRLSDAEIEPSGIAPEFLAPRPAPPWRGELLYVGRIDPRKGVQDAVAALAELPRQTRLTLVGDGDARAIEALGRLADRLGVSERVSRLPMHSRQALVERYAACDAVLFPVRWEEPWGLVPLEAMGIGRPVIATGRGGSGEYLRDGENCLLAPAEDPAALAAAARRLEEDPELRARLVEQGLRTAPRYTEARFNAAAQRALEAAAGQLT
jgi:glycosyltransferase involved in cell wall biosynthesis